MATGKEVDVTKANLFQFVEYLGRLTALALHRNEAVTFVIDNEGCVRLVPTPPELVRQGKQTSEENL